MPYDVDFTNTQSDNEHQSCSDPRVDRLHYSYSYTYIYTPRLAT